MGTRRDKTTNRKVKKRQFIIGLIYISFFLQFNSFENFLLEVFQQSVVAFTIS
jgi:hypothetical protein